MQTAEKLSITLPPEMVRIIREALRGWMNLEQHLATLDTAIARGVADADAGRTQEIGTVREELRRHFEL